MLRPAGTFGHSLTDEGFGHEVLRLAKLFCLSCREPIEAVEKRSVEWRLASIDGRRTLSTRLLGGTAGMAKTLYCDHIYQLSVRWHRAGRLRALSKPDMSAKWAMRNSEPLAS